jgi:hypothetical protein
MLHSLRDAFRQAVVNFRTELHRDDVPSQGGPRLASLARELEAAGRRILELRGELDQVQAELAREEKEAAICRRREEMARQAGQSETAEVAADFVRRHKRRVEIFRDKARVLEREIEDRSDEVSVMRDRVNEMLRTPSEADGVAEDRAHD